MVVDRLIATGRLAPELRGPLRAVLMARHLHLHQRQHGHATASAMLLPMIKSIAAAREAYRVRDRAAGTLALARSPPRFLLPLFLPAPRWDIASDCESESQERLMN